MTQGEMVRTSGQEESATTCCQKTLVRGTSCKSCPATRMVVGLAVFADAVLAHHDAVELCCRMERQGV